MAQQFNGGVLGGMTISKATGNPKAGGWKKVGMVIGGFINLDFSRHSALQMELEYIMKGASDNPDVSKGKTDSYLLRVGYIEMPVLYQFKIIEKFSLETGPSVNFLLHSYERINGADNVIEPVYSSVGFSWNIGASFYISDRLWFNFRANNSLINTRTRTVTDMVWRFWAYGEYNDVFTFSLFYKLSKLGKDRGNR
jgi:hypothetical protein